MYTYIFTQRDTLNLQRSLVLVMQTIPANSILKIITINQLLRIMNLF